MKIEKIVLIFITNLIISKINGQEIICTTCNCDQETKTINCTYKTLNALFTIDDWNELKNQSANFTYEIIDLSHNSIINLTHFPALPNIKVLNLSYNDIAHIDPLALFELYGLKELDLSHNKIISSVFKQDIFKRKHDSTPYEPMKNLKVLKLSSNKLHNLDLIMFQHMPLLEELYLSDNPFKKINKNSEVALAQISKLKVLDLSGLELTDLPLDIFYAVRTLEFLNLARNNFSRIPDSLIDCVNLKELILDGNPLNNLDDYNKFPKLPKLEKLSLSYIQTMENIGERTLSNLWGLKEFHATHNFRLSMIHPSAFSRVVIDKNLSTIQWPLIERISLNNNNLSILDYLTLSNWDTMKEIDLRHNPWTCTCENKWIIEEIVPKMIAKNESLAQNLSCAEPFEMHGKPLRDLSEDKNKMICLNNYQDGNEGANGSLQQGFIYGILACVSFVIAVGFLMKTGNGLPLFYVLCFCFHVAGA